MLSGLCPLGAGLPRLAAAAACTGLLSRTCNCLTRLGALRQRRVTFSAAAAPASPATAGAALAAATKLISLTVNGQQVQVPEGSSILTAATHLGIHVSTREAAGSCAAQPSRRPRVRARSAVPAAQLTFRHNAWLPCPL